MGGHWTGGTVPPQPPSPTLDPHRSPLGEKNCPPPVSQKREIVVPLEFFLGNLGYKNTIFLAKLSPTSPLSFGKIRHSPQSRPNFMSGANVIPGNVVAVTKIQMEFVQVRERIFISKAKKVLQENFALCNCKLEYLYKKLLTY